MRSGYRAANAVEIGDDQEQGQQSQHPISVFHELSRGRAEIYAISRALFLVTSSVFITVYVETNGVSESGSCVRPGECLISSCRARRPRNICRDSDSG